MPGGGQYTDNHGCSHPVSVHQLQPDEMAATGPTFFSGTFEISDSTVPSLKFALASRTATFILRRCSFDTLRVDDGTHVRSHFTVEDSRMGNVLFDRTPWTMTSRLRFARNAIGDVTNQHAVSIFMSPLQNATVHEWIYNTFTVAQSTNNLLYSALLYALEGSEIESESELIVEGNTFNGYIDAAVQALSDGGRIVVGGFNVFNAGGLNFVHANGTESYSDISIHSSPGVAYFACGGRDTTLNHFRLSIFNSTIRLNVSIRSQALVDSTVSILESSVGVTAVGESTPDASTFALTATEGVVNSNVTLAATCIGSSTLTLAVNNLVASNYLLSEVNCRANSDLLTVGVVSATDHSNVTVANMTLPIGALQLTGSYDRYSSLQVIDSSLRQLVLATPANDGATVTIARNTIMQNRTSQPAVRMDNTTVQGRHTAQFWINNTITSANHHVIYYDTHGGSPSVTDDGTIYFAGNVLKTPPTGACASCMALDVSIGGGRIIYEPTNVIDGGGLNIRFKNETEIGSHISVYNSNDISSIRIGHESVTMENFSVAIYNSSISSAVTLTCSNFTDSTFDVMFLAPTLVPTFAAAYAVRSNITYANNQFLGTSNTTLSFGLADASSFCFFENTVASGMEFYMNVLESSVASISQSTFHELIRFVGPFLNSTLHLQDNSLNAISTNEMPMTASVLSAVGNRFFSPSTHCATFNFSPLRNGTVHQWINNTFETQSTLSAYLSLRALYYVSTPSQVESESAVYLSGNLFEGEPLKVTLSAFISGGHIVYEASNVIHSGGMDLTYTGPAERHNNITIANSPGVGDVSVVTGIDGARMEHFSLTVVNSTIGGLLDLRCDGPLVNSTVVLASSTFLSMDAANAKNVLTIMTKALENSTVFLSGLSIEQLGSVSLACGDVVHTNVTLHNITAPNDILVLSGAFRTSYVAILESSLGVLTADESHFVTSQLLVRSNEFSDEVTELPRMSCNSCGFYNESVALVMQNTLGTNATNATGASLSAAISISGNAAVRIANNFFYRNASIVTTNNITDTTDTATLEVSFNTGFRGPSAAAGILVGCANLWNCVLFRNLASCITGCLDVIGYERLAGTSNYRYWACNRQSVTSGSVDSTWEMQFYDVYCSSGTTVTRCEGVRGNVYWFRPSEFLGCDLQVSLSSLPHAASTWSDGLSRIAATATYSPETAGCAPAAMMLWTTDPVAWMWFWLSNGTLPTAPTIPDTVFPPPRLPPPPPAPLPPLPPLPPPPSPSPSSTSAAAPDSSTAAPPPPHSTTGSSLPSSLPSPLPSSFPSLPSSFPSSWFPPAAPSSQAATVSPAPSFSLPSGFPFPSSAIPPPPPDSTSASAVSSFPSSFPSAYSSLPSSLPVPSAPTPAPSSQAATIAPAPSSSSLPSSFPAPAPSPSSTSAAPPDTSTTAPPPPDSTSAVSSSSSFASRLQSGSSGASTSLRPSEPEAPAPSSQAATIAPAPSSSSSTVASSLPSSVPETPGPTPPQATTQRVVVAVIMECGADSAAVVDMLQDFLANAGGKGSKVLQQRNSQRQRCNTTTNSINLNFTVDSSISRRASPTSTIDPLSSASSSSFALPIFNLTKEILRIPTADWKRVGVTSRSVHAAAIDAATNPPAAAPDDDGNSKAAVAGAAVVTVALFLILLIVAGYMFKKKGVGRPATRIGRSDVMGFGASADADEELLGVSSTQPQVEEGDDDVYFLHHGHRRGDSL